METMTYRSNPGVDPHLDVWEMQIPIYLFLGGLAAGILVISAVAGLTKSKSWDRTLAAWGSLAAILMLSFGMLALFLDR
ncbi:MAG: polysulfide reductase, partial [Deltaproteobacteria bacterium]|nr:polysulfide reductase [Deltaproteobacteria bacterium]